MNNQLTFTTEALVVEPQGLDKIWTLTSKISIPWQHVRGATYDPGMSREPKGWRGPGLATGQKFSGTFHADGGRQFWNVSGSENTVVIELADEHFERLVLSLTDPVEQTAQINARAAG